MDLSIRPLEWAILVHISRYSAVWKLLIGLFSLVSRSLALALLESSVPSSPSTSSLSANPRSKLLPGIDKPSTLKGIASVMIVSVGLAIGGKVCLVIKFSDGLPYPASVVSPASDVGLEVGDRVGVTPGTGGEHVESHVE